MFRKYKREVPDYSDETTEAYEAFYLIPISRICEEFIAGKLNAENHFLNRLLKITLSEQQSLAKWIAIRHLKRIETKSQISPREKTILGFAYLNGIHTEANFERAVDLFLEASAFSEPTADLILGELHYANHILNLATAYFTRAVTHGSGRALTFLGIIEPSIVDSQYWYAQSAAAHDSLGLYYLATQDPSPHRGNNIILLKEAAKFGEPSGLAKLGDNLIKQNQLEKAAYYYRLAAQRFSIAAYDNLYSLHLKYKSNPFICFQFCLASYYYLDRAPQALGKYFLTLISKNFRYIDQYIGNEPLEALQYLLPEELKWRPLRRLAILYSFLGTLIPLELVNAILVCLIKNPTKLRLVEKQLQDELFAQQEILNSNISLFTPLKVDVAELKWVSKQTSGLFKSKRYGSLNSKQQIILAARTKKISYTEARFFIQKIDKKRLDNLQEDKKIGSCATLNF